MLSVHDAAHGESGIAPAGTAVVDKLVCSLVGQAHEVWITPGTRTHQAYRVERAVEQFRCTYGLNPLYRETFAGSALQVVGIDAENEVRIVELPAHKFFIATLFLPQLTSSVETPHPLILAYLKAAMAP